MGTDTDYMVGVIIDGHLHSLDDITNPTSIHQLLQHAQNTIPPTLPQTLRIEIQRNTTPPTHTTTHR